ncbi:MAG: extracellular solute-binding protein [Chloroflexota bacterium]|nr:extracellular solute-binding protein [Chloroflexota bacterium]
MLVVALFVALSVLPTSAQEPVIIRWFVGLGTGINPDQIPPQEQIVADFNASRSDIQIEVQFVETGAAIDTLSTLIASGSAPDLIGPVGVEGSNAFADAWLDLQPLVDSSGFDLAQFDSQTVDFYRIPGQGLVGLPFGVFPSFIGYNKAIFDEAGLNYPPVEFGAPYVMPDGTEVEWNMDTLAEVARMLTVDANGYAANEPEFDAASIEQYGFSTQFNSGRGMGTLFSAGNILAEDGTAQIPDAWRTAWAFYHDGIFGEQPFMPSEIVVSTDEWGNGNSFQTGKIGMFNMHLWYIPCCLGTIVENWGIAAVPSYEGNTTAKLHADNFRIMGTTAHPEETFEVLLYLTTERGGELLQIYGGMPAREADQAAFFETFTANYPDDITWDVVTSALSYADVPSHEGNLPNFPESNARIAQFKSLLESTSDLDLDAEIETLRADLQAIFDRAAASS